MDGYRIKQIGHDFVVFSGDVSVLKCQTEKDAQTIIAAALDLLENPDEWWNVLRQRLAASEAARQSSSAGGDLAAFDTNAVTVTPNELAKVDAPSVDVAREGISLNCFELLD